MADIATTYLDADSDSPRLARPALLDAVQRINRQPINVKDYGATGDGTTNDTTSVQNALNAAVAAGRNLHFPAGEYKVANISLTTTTAHISITGDSSGHTILKNTIDTNPVFSIGTSCNQINVSNLTFAGNGTVRAWGTGNGVAGNASLSGYTRPTVVAAVRCTDVNHVNFDACYFQDALIGLELRGGIVVVVTRCYAYYNDTYGYKIWRDSGSSWPNLVTLRDSSAIENGFGGVYFDHGRLLLIDGGDMEGNGKNTTVATTIACGVYVGANTGNENGATAGPNSGAFHSQAITIRNVWFEQNGNNNGSGVPNSTSMACVVHNHGILTVENCTGTNVVAGRYFRINGGQYHIKNFHCESAMTVTKNYVDEGASSGNANLCSVNTITNLTNNTTGTAANITAANMLIDPSKTIVDGRKFAEKQVQSGSGSTTSGALTVTFPVAFAATPNVVAQVLTNDGGQRMYSAEVYGVSTTGFSLRSKSITSGVITTTDAHTIMWIAVAP